MLACLAWLGMVGLAWFDLIGLVVAVVMVMALVADVVEEHHMLLGKELIHVFSPDVLIIFDVGAGEMIKASLAQRVVCVGIVPNKAHKEFVMQELRRFVLQMNLANVVDGCPAKPVMLTRFETANPDNEDVKAALGSAQVIAGRQQAGRQAGRQCDSGRQAGRQCR